MFRLTRAGIIISSASLVAGKICWNTSSTDGSGFQTGPLVASEGGHLLFTEGDAKKRGSKLVAVNSLDGSTVWNATPFDAVQLISVLPSAKTFLVGGSSYDDDFFHLMSLDEATGEVRWRFEDNSSTSDFSDSWAVDGELLLAAGFSGVAAFDAMTGERRWSLPNDRGDQYIWFSSDVAVRGSFVAYGVVEGHFDVPGNFSLLDAATGQVAWTKPGNTFGLEIAERDGRAIVLAQKDVRQQAWSLAQAELAAYDAASGRQLWSKRSYDLDHWDEITLLSCGLLHTSEGVLRPEDGKLAYRTGARIARQQPTGPRMSGNLTPRPVTASGASGPELFIEDDAVVARDCASGRQLWRAALPERSAGYWEAPAALHFTNSSAECKPEAVAIDYHKMCMRNICRYFAAAAGVSRDSQVLV